MKNRLCSYICIFVVFKILQSSICYAKIINDTHRTKREISAAEMSQSKGDTNYAKKINLEHEEKNDSDLEEDDTYQDTNKKHKISRKALNFMSSIDFHPSNTEEAFKHDVSRYLNSQHSKEGLEKTEEAEEADEDEEVIKREHQKNQQTSNLERLRRDINSNFNKYTDQDERSSLYDDYEEKDIAKRGVFSGLEDYEEMEDNLPGIEDMVAVQESTNEAENRETQDARVKRDQAEMLDKSKASLDNSAKLEGSKTEEKNPYSRQISQIELSKSFDEASAPNTIKDFGSNVISKLSDSSKIQEPASIIASYEKDESNAEHKKRVEEEIQRKIDSIKEEIERDIEAQQRIKDIENNNARFDELQDQEYEDKERQNFENEPIHKRQTIAKRSIQKIADTPFERTDKKRSLRGEQHKKRQHRSTDNKIDALDTSKQSENLRRQVVTNYVDKPFEQIPSKEFFKKKCKRVRQTFLVNNDQHQAKRRQLRSYSLPSDRAVVTSENKLFINPELNSYLHMNNKMLQQSSSIDNKNENNEEKQNPSVEHSDSLISLTGSSQELSPRLEKEYKEAFGGLQSEPGNALARFKRVKRMLTNMS